LINVFLPWDKLELCDSGMEHLREIAPLPSDFEEQLMVSLSLRSLLDLRM